MDKWIILTFWTKPMGPKWIESNLKTAKISLYYAHRSGYRVRMYTDRMGYDYLKNVGYDDLLTTLDDIPETIPTKVFAYPKYIALKNEPVGVLHTDFDVFLKKPCVDGFFEHPEMMDVILQGTDGDQMVENDKNYQRGRIFFNRSMTPTSFFATHIHASNVGIIGFTNPDFKELYLNNYKQFVDFHKDELAKTNFIPDLFFEQVHINYLIHRYKFKSYDLLPESIYYSSSFQAYAKKIGYQHILGQWKYTDAGHEYITDFCNRMYIYRTAAIQLNWVTPNCGQSELANNDNRFINFDDLIKNISSSDADNAVEKIFKMFNDTCRFYDGQNKVLLTSNVRLLHAFYHDFGNIYVDENNLTDEMKNEINFIKDRVHVTYFTGDISQYANELT